MILATPQEFGMEPFDGLRLYSNYQDSPLFMERAKALSTRFAPADGEILVAGCGWGYLVRNLTEMGYSVWGVDASPWAIQMAQSLFPNLSSRFICADVTKPLQLTALVKLIVTDDLLTVLNDEEVEQALHVMTNVVSRMVHFVSCGDAALPGHDPRVNWKSLQAWQQRLSPAFVIEV